MNASLRRKVIYIVVIVVLLVPLVRLSAPATYENGSRRPGGVLSQLRYENQLSQANLGGIDPASEAMRMASLGLRGIAANVLWSKAFHYKKVEDFDSLRATLNQITNLQPNFISVWEFQAHNLSYNISVEFDNFRHRYHWIKKGIAFLLEGTQYNRDEPRLLWNVGWYVAHKLGRADEHVSFRRLFRTDQEFHQELDRPYIEVDGPEAKGPDGYPDNWLVGRLWFREGQRVVDTKGVPLRGKSPLVFNSHAPMCMINYAAEIEKEGYLNEKAQYAWSEAGKAWNAFGDRQIPTSWGVNIRLNDLEREAALERELEEELEKLVPGVREQLRQEKLAKLPANQQEALKTAEDQRTPEQMALAMEAEMTTQVSHQEVAANAPEAVRTEARVLARRLERKMEDRRRIARYRNIVNYGYWETRCEVEQTNTAIQARRLVYEADKLWEKASFDAKDRYEEAWQYWARIMDQYPDLRNDVTAEDLVDAVKRYRSVIEQLGEEWPPADFVLTDVLVERAEMGDPSVAEFLQARQAGGGAAGSKPAPRENTPDNASETAPAEEKPEAEKDQPKPTEEKPEAEKDQPKPAEEKPEAEKDQPKPTEEKPEAEKDQPKPTEEKPEAEKDQPKPAEEKPEAEKDQPKPAEEKPEAEKDQPEADAEKPEAEKDQPEPDAEKPEAEKDQPEPDAEKPEAEKDQPKPDAEKPEAEKQEPAPEEKPASDETSAGDAPSGDEETSGNADGEKEQGQSEDDGKEVELEQGQ